MHMLKSMTRRALALAAGALLLAGAPGPADQAEAAESAIDDVLRRGVLNVGMSTFVPWAMRDKEGNLVGFEIDVARRLAEDLGVEVNFVPTAWDGIIPALLARKFDVIISGMTVTTQRNLTVNFTEAYAHSGMRLVAHAEKAAGMTSLADYDRPEVVFSQRRGSTPAEFVRRKLPNATMNLFDEDGQSFLEIINGRSTATFAYDPTPAEWISRYPQLLYVPIDQLYNEGSEAFAVRRGDPDTLNVFNNWIRLRWRDGFLEERADFWFRTRDWEDLMPAG